MNSMPWVVVLRMSDRPKDTYCYGPIHDEDIAHRFAAWLSREVDPATAHRLFPPIDELINRAEAGTL